MSSTTLASTNIGVPLPRSSTKSSIVSLANVTSPRTTSWTTVVPVGHAEAQHPARARLRGRGRGSSRRSPACPSPWRGPGSARRSGRSSRPGPAAYSRSAAATCAAALALWKYGPSNAGSSAPMPDPGQGVDDALGPLRPVAGLVGVLDAQHERAAEPAGQRPVVQRRARPADVEEAGRRRGDAEAGTRADMSRSTLPTADPGRIAGTRVSRVDAGVRARLRSWRRATDSVVRS